MSTGVVELSAAMTPRHRAYIARMQGHPEQAMFRSEDYRECTPGAARKTSEALKSEVLYVDQNLHNAVAFADISQEYRESNGGCMVQEMENSSDLTLVNSTFISSEPALEESDFQRATVEESCGLHPGLKRKLEPVEEEQPPGKRCRVGNERQLRQLHHSRYISSDFISSEGIEISTIDTHSYSPFEVSQPFSQFSQAKSSQYTPFPLYTAQDISHAVLSSFDPIFGSED